MEAMRRGSSYFPVSALELRCNGYWFKRNLIREIIQLSKTKHIFKTGTLIWRLLILHYTQIGNRYLLSNSWFTFILKTPRSLRRNVGLIFHAEVNPERRYAGGILIPWACFLQDSALSTEVFEISRRHQHPRFGTRSSELPSVDIYPPIGLPISRLHFYWRTNWRSGVCKV
jgi:hypothetical protein